MRKEENTKKRITIIKTFKVKEPMPLLEFLFLKITNDSKNNIKKYLSNNQILVNGMSVKQFNFMLTKEDVVELLKEPFKGESQPALKLDIIYEDNEFLVINKPAGLLSVESDKEITNTAYFYANEYMKAKDKRARVYQVHRLDLETSGVLLFVKDEKLKEKLSLHWQDYIITRKYIAVCEGTFEKKSGTVKSYLKNNVNNLVYSTNDEKNGKLAITHYQVKKENGKYSLVEVNIDTGRKNQIRVHMKDLGHGVVGDTKYQIKANPLKRLGLHAQVLEIKHPTTKKTLKFIARTPKVFESIF